MDITRDMCTYGKGGPVKVIGEDDSVDISGSDQLFGSPWGRMMGDSTASSASFVTASESVMFDKGVSASHTDMGSISSHWNEESVFDAYSTAQAFEQHSQCSRDRVFWRGFQSCS